MKINKRLLSFFLAVLMVVSTFGDSVYAISENVKANSANKKTEIEGKVEGNKEVFTFDLSKLTEKAEPITTKAMPARAPRRAPVQYDTTVNIKAEGLNGGAFDWDALPNKEFKLIAKWKTKDGQEHEKPFATITAEGTTTHNVGWPVDGTMTGNASIETDYNQNVEVRVVDVYSSSTGGAGKLVFDITLKELAEPRAEVKYLDPYGRAITDPADLPSATDAMPKVKADELTDVEIDLPKTSGKINMRSSDDIDEDELHKAGNGLTFKVDGKTTGETVTIDNKEYKLDISAPNAKEIGTIKMVYQKDVLIPPAKDDGSGEPVDPAEGYVRLTFDANENKADGITGTHKNGLYAGKQKSYIDVKEGVQYDNANLQAVIKELSTTGKKLVNGKEENVGQDAKKPWTPTVPADATPVTTATYNAQYEKSAAEQVTELGGLNPQTIKVWKGDDPDWAKGVAPKTTDKNDADLVQQLLDNAEVTDLSSRSSDAAGKFKGKLLVTFGDGSTLEVDKQWLYVWEHIVTVDPDDSDSPSEDDLPSDKVKVLFEPLPNRGVKSINTKGTTYAKKGTVFQDKDFPQDITYEDGYKGPVTWTPSHHTISNDSRKGYDKRRGAFVFKASATKSAATQITEAGGLKGIDLAAWVGDTLDAKFWKDGVALADTVQDADGKLAALLAGATVTDKSNRNTNEKGTKPGKLVVTFADGSALEVDQKLFVYDKKDVVPTDPTQPTPKDAVVVIYQKGEGVAELTGTGKTLVKSGETLTDDDFPQATLEEGRKDLTWSGQTAGNPKDYTVTENNKVFTATAGKTVIPTNPDDPKTPEGYVLVTFEKGEHGTLKGIGADGQQTEKAAKLAYNVKETATWKDMKDYIPTAVAEKEWKVADPAWDPQLPAEGTTVTAGKYTAQYAENATPTKNSEDYDPHYTGKSGKPGETVQIDPPTFTKTGVTGNVPAPTDGTKTTTFAKNDPKQTNVTVNPNTGAITVVIPQDAKDGDVITVPVDVTYPDGSKETVDVKVTVKDKTTPTPQGPSVTYPDTDMDKGDTKTVIPEIKDKKGEPTRPDTTPEVVQPGNGVVVTPHPDGTITVTIPEGYDGPSTIVIPVVVTVDGERIHTTLTIRVRDNKPVIDYDIPELKIHEYTPTYPVFASVDKKVVEKEVINSHDQYIFGYPDDTIRPDGDMTRAEAIAVVARLQKLDLSDKSSKIYKDTKADMWYNGAINAAFREGYLLEKEGENVRPNDKITRAELAELISHIDKKNNAIAPFDDVKGHKFEAAINQAYGNGRIEGYPDGTFKPDNTITRAEVATMLNKLYDRYPDKNFIDANQNLVHNYKDMSYKGHWGYYELVEAYHSHTYLRLKDNMEEWKVIIK